MDREFARLLIEDVTSVMSKNLVAILDAMERQHSELRSVLEGYSARLRQVEARITHIEGVLSKRPAEREKEHQAILDAITQAHGDGE